MKETISNPIKILRSIGGVSNTPQVSLIGKASPGKSLDRNAIMRLSQQDIQVAENKGHFLNQSSTATQKALSQTYGLMKNGLHPSKDYLLNNIRGIKNSNFRNIFLSLLTPATTIFGLLEIFKGIHGALHKSKISTGAALTTGLAAISLSKIFKKLATNGGFQNLQNLRQDTSNIRNHVVLILLLAIYQQFRTEHGFVQQFFNSNVKKDTVGLLSGLSFLNPINMIKGAVGLPISKNSDSITSLAPQKLEQLVEESNESTPTGVSDGTNLYNS